jgi:hypothetical protein
LYIWSCAIELYPNFPAAAFEGVPYAIGDQFRHDDAEFPAALGSHLKRVRGQNELDVSVVQPGTPDRLTKHSKVTRSIDDSAMGGHFEGLIDVRTVMQETRYIR